MSFSPAVSVSHWIDKPAPFNETKCGKRAVFSEDNSVVERRGHEEDARDCVCYTAHPLPLLQVWQIEILDTSDKWWGAGMKIGITLAVPDKAPAAIPGSWSGPQEWNYDFTSLYHNKGEICTDLPRLTNLSPGETVGILLSPDGDLHIYHNKTHVKKAASGVPVNQPLWGAMDVRGNYTKVKSDFLCDPALYLRAALKDGYIPHKDDLFLVHGPGGVGKSSLIAMFLGQQRDHNRVSTALADEALHICPIRDVSTSMFTEQWELVDIDRQARMVAHTSHYILSRQGAVRVDEAEADENGATAKQPFLSVSKTRPPPRLSRRTQSTRQKPFPKTSKKSKRSTMASKVWRKIRKPFNKSSRAVSSTAPSSPVDTDQVTTHFPTAQSGVPTPEDDTSSPQGDEQITDEDAKPLLSSLGPDPDHIGRLLDNFKAGLQSLILGSQALNDLILYYSIRVLDSGGQPQFHEVVSIVLPAVTGIVSVFKLSERLDVHGEVVYYKDGEQANDPYLSYLTNEQVIRHDLLAIQSEACQSGVEEIPSLAFVGTFLDQQHICPGETPDQKDERLHSMITEILPEESQQCVISNGESLEQVTFRVNTRTPSAKDYQTAAKLKGALRRRSRVKPKNLPLKWCGYEVALRKLMKQLGRQILSREECEFIGYKLGFDSPSLKACLHYLHKFHIISFYDILPSVIFASSQVILDKITELVTYSLELKKGDSALLGVDRKFHQKGILSFDILQSESCSRHYKRNLFTPHDLLTVLKSLLIITEVGSGEYLMPCVLEVSDIYPSPPVPKEKVQSSFVLHFSKLSPIVGIYCCTITYLMTQAKWKLLSKSREVVQVARNSVAFEVPGGYPGKVTFLDPLSSYLEVVVELPAMVMEVHGASLYRKIRDTFFTAMKEAMKTLKYEVRTPELSFLCPEQSPQCSTSPHLANIDTSHSFLTCSVNSVDVCHPLTPQQIMWLPTSDSGSKTEIRKPQGKTGTTVPLITISGEKPTLPELLGMNLPLRVRDKYDKFGVLLLKDDAGDKVAIIKHNCGMDAERITSEILRRWLRGDGVDVTWEKLISTLKMCDFALLADQIEMVCNHQ